VSAVLRVAVTAGALRVPPTYFVAGQLRHLADVEVAFFAGTADVREPLPGPVRVAPGGRLGPAAVRRLLGGTTWPTTAAAVRRFRPDVVHQHFATWSRVAVDAARSLPAPLVVSLHGYDVPAVAMAASPLVRWASRGVLGEADEFLAGSRYLADRAVALGFPADRVRVHHLGVDTDTFVPAGTAERRRAVAAGRLLVLGRLAPGKAVVDVLDALAAMPGRERPALDVVGSGPDEPALRRHAERLRLDVEFHGLLPRAAVVGRLQRAAAVVLPACENAGRRETAGLVLLEAQACGVPVVAYASGGTPEMLVDGRTGWLVRERDVHGLSAALARAVRRSPDQTMRMGEDAARFVRAERSERGWALRLRELYAELVERRDAAVLAGRQP
jgi:glycosyltransferase involved in cell wall biosynthesis